MFALNQLYPAKHMALCHTLPIGLGKYILINAHDVFLCLFLVI